MKLCIDCKHYTPDAENWHTPQHQKQYAICTLTSTVSPTHGTTCREERLASWVGARLLGVCGHEGRFWEAK